MLKIPKIIAHRGASLLAPENTLAAFSLAQQCGATWIEFDVQLTADGVPVILHDATLDRTSTGKGKLRDYTYEALQTLDFGSWFSPSFKAEKIPSLEQVLLLATHTSLGVNIELKLHKGDNPAHLAQRVHQVLQQFPHLDVKKVIVSSSAAGLLQGFYKMDKAFALGYLHYRWDTTLEKALTDPLYYSIHLPFSIIDKATVDAVHAQGKKILTYTVDEPTLAEQLLQLGVDSIFSNNPTLLK